MPTEAVTSSPNGSPSTTSHSPTLRSSESPMRNGCRRGVSTDSRARSSRTSRPTSLAGTSVPSGSTTRSSVAAAAMWSLVRTNTPCDSIRKPVPRETSAEDSGAPGNIAAGPALIGELARIETIP